MFAQNSKLEIRDSHSIDSESESERERADGETLEEWLARFLRVLLNEHKINRSID